ncbi:MAG: hypothetical protein LBJ58_06200 [Tannerellaceae bacterium]|jgi:bacteriorhodopsin|nr:hypothetical protein [Tannerellaceae bacterium]
MAVTKIRKFSSWVLVACTIIMLGVVGLFFFGGDNEPYNGQWNPKYTDTLLYWMYGLFAITVVSILCFVILQFINNFKADKRQAFFALGILVLFAIMFFTTYSIGDGTPIQSLLNKSDTEKFNVSFWLKLTDMFLFSIYIMFVLTVLAVIAGSLKRIFEK